MDAAALFPEGAAAYLRVEGSLLSRTAETLLEPGDRKAARPFLDRTDRVTAAVFLPGPGEPPDAAPRGPELYGLAEGSYPAGAAAFRLRLSRDWKKEGRSLSYRGGEVRVAFADRRLLAAGTGDLEPLLARLSDPGPHPVPEDLRPLWEAEGALWLERPAAVLGALLGKDAPDIPASGVLLSLSPGEAAYRGAWVFEFPDGRSARIFSPLCRLFHVLWIRAAWGADAEAAEKALGQTVWRVEGGRVTAEGFTIPGPEALAVFVRAPG